MGTRADFYIQREEELEWMGAIAWDGYDVTWKGQPEGGGIEDATTAEEFLTALGTFTKDRDDWSSQEDGWPWPWEDSHLTDYSYVFNGESVDVYIYGTSKKLRDAYYAEEERCDEAGIECAMEEPEKSNIFPNMKDKQKEVAMGEKSGLMILGVPTG